MELMSHLEGDIRAIGDNRHGLLSMIVRKQSNFMQRKPNSVRHVCICHWSPRRES